MDPKKKLSGNSINFKKDEKIIFSKIHEPMIMKELEKKIGNSQEKKLISEHFKFLDAVKTKHIHKAKNERNDETTRNINMIENNFRKKYDGEYIKKICQLLKKKDKNYSKKRNNLEHTKVSLDENNNLYLTLPKFDYGKRIRELMKDRREQEKIEEEKKKQNDQDLKKAYVSQEKIEDKRTRLEKLIPEFYINQNSISDESDEEKKDKVSNLSNDSSDISELNEEQQKELFEKLKTKAKFFEGNFNKNKYLNGHFRNYSHGDVVLPFLPTKVNFVKNNEDKNNKQNNESLNREKFQSNTNRNYSPVINGKGNFSDLEIKNAAASPYFRMKEEPPGLIDSDPTILNIKKIRDKFKILKNMEKDKEKILTIDLFKYDKKKWEKKNLRESERIILGIKEFEDRRNDIMRRIFSNSDVQKLKAKNSSIELDEN